MQYASSQTDDRAGPHRTDSNPIPNGSRNVMLANVRAERDAVFAADEADLVAGIRDAGYDIDSVYDLVNNTPHPHLKRRFLGEYPAAYPILIRHLDMPHLDRVREGIIRALTVKNGGAELENALLTHFRKETDPSLRWVLANACTLLFPIIAARSIPRLLRSLLVKQTPDNQVLHTEPRSRAV